MTAPFELLIDGDDSAPVTVVLAHGAGAGMEHPWLQTVAAGLAGHGLRVARFEFPYMRARRSGVRRGPDPMPVLQDAWRAAVAAANSPCYAMAGKSMGGRIATMLADELGAVATVAFGYPFHPPGKPAQLRTAHLAALRTRTLILQGERDRFGLPDEVASYVLSDAITLRWLEDGDHSLAPRKKSGHSVVGHMATAIAAAAEFVLSAAADRDHRRR
ncbi:MAG: alpha/beta hydrolase [Planctomycetes bacterium]|nr:alpha/beta hydrolase [Planctomycetota bacterium]